MIPREVAPPEEAPVRLGLIGLGWIGETHARLASQLETCRLVAASDSDPTKERVARKWGASFYPDYRRMVERESLEGVVIAVPNQLHEEVGTFCALRGLHVLMEKPIAPSVESGERLVREARESGVRLLVGHYRRFHPKVEMARNMIRGGELGKLVGVSGLWCVYKPDSYYAESPWRTRKGAGPVLVNGTHEIDTLRYLCGEIQRVYAETSRGGRGFEVEDTASVSFRFADGAVASLLFSDTVPSLWAYEYGMGENPLFHPSTEDTYRFCGTEASLAFPSLRKVFYPHPARKGWQYPVALEAREVERADPYERQLRHFCRVVRGLEEPRSSGEDALRTLKVALAVLESAETCQPVTV